MNGSRLLETEAGSEVLQAIRVRERPLPLRPVLRVERGALATCVVDETLDRGLVDEVRRALVERDHGRVGSELLASLRDQCQPLLRIELLVRSGQPLGDVPVAVLRVVA